MCMGEKESKVKNKKNETYQKAFIWYVLFYDILKELESGIYLALKSRKELKE